MKEEEEKEEEVEEEEGNKEKEKEEEKELLTISGISSIWVLYPAVYSLHIEQHRQGTACNRKYP